jgi:metallo-beta-lactamase family protein
LHDDAQVSEEEFIKVILRTCFEREGKLIIPAFSVGRTQELVYILNRLIESGNIPSLNVYVDSPFRLKRRELLTIIQSVLTKNC